MAVKIINRIKIKQQLKKALDDDKLYERLGRFGVKYIKDVTRTGQTMVDGKTKKPLPPLSPVTKQIRKHIRKFNRFSKFFSPAISNVTLTGSLLNSLLFKVKKVRFGGRQVLIDVDANKKRKPIKYSSGGKAKHSKLNNKEIYDELEKKGFGFLGIDDDGKKKAAKIVEQHLLREIRRINRGR